MILFVRVLGLEAYSFSTPFGYFVSTSLQNSSKAFQARVTLFIKKATPHAHKFYFVPFVRVLGLEPRTTEV
jgi:hypothetical protein